MARTKGALGMKNREGEQNTSNTTKAKTATVTEKSVDLKKRIIPINKELIVEGFNPDDFKQYYDDGTPYLPFKIQLMWFRLKYPNGKTPVFRPEWSLEKTPGEYVATARVYRDIADPIDNYLSEASAKRGPNTRIQGTEVEIDPYMDVQRAALSMALRLAGFWCSLTEDDFSKELKKDLTSSKPVEEKTSKEASEKTSSKGMPNKAFEAPVEETPTEAVEAPVEETPTEAEAPVEETSTEDVETPVEETPTEAEAPVEETSTEDVETPVEETPTEAEAPVEETSTEDVETPVEETPAEDTKVPEENAPKELTEEEKSELEELRAIPFSNGYRNCTIGDLETGRENGKDSDDGNLFHWLLNSAIAERKYSKHKAAAIRISELCHPDWLSE